MHTARVDKRVTSKEIRGTYENTPNGLIVWEEMLSDSFCYKLECCRRDIKGASKRLQAPRAEICIAAEKKHAKKTDLVCIAH
eukprot:6205165-Amphidinium_carterae.1